MFWKKYKFLWIMLLMFSMLGCKKLNTSSKLDAIQKEQQTEKEVTNKLEEIEKVKNEPEVAVAPEPTAQFADESSIRPDVKEVLDSYEIIMNEYCDFMENYDAKDTSKILKYLDLLQKYTDALDKFEKIDEKELNDSELHYYTDVNLRVLGRLAKIKY